MQLPHGAIIVVSMACEHEAAKPTYKLKTKFVISTEAIITTKRHTTVPRVLTSQGGIDGILSELVLLGVGGALDQIADQVEHHTADQGVPRLSHAADGDRTGLNKTQGQDII